MADGSLAQFKATLARKMARKEKAQGKFDRKKMGFKKSGEKEEYDFPKLPESELEKVKTEIREKFKAERRKNMIFLGSIIIIAICILLYLA